MPNRNLLSHYVNTKKTGGFFRAFASRTCTSSRPKRTSGRRRTSKRRKSSGTSRPRRCGWKHHTAAYRRLLLGTTWAKALECRWRILILHGSNLSLIAFKSFSSPFFCHPSTLLPPQNLVLQGLRTSTPPPPKVHQPSSHGPMTLKPVTTPALRTGRWHSAQVPVHHASVFRRPCPSLAPFKMTVGWVNSKIMSSTDLKKWRMFSFEVVYILHVFEITGFLPWEQKGTGKTLGRPSIKAAKWSNGNTSEAGSFSNGVLKGFWKVPPTFLEILWRQLSTNV